MAADPTSIAQHDEVVLAAIPVPHVRVLTLNRPSKRNALSHAVIARVLSLLADAATDDSVRVVVVVGAGTVFSAGADIREISQLDMESARRNRYLEDLCNGLRSFRKPILAAVEGFALGGGFELALMCDLLIASEEASFGLPEVKIGLLPGAGGTQRLTNAVGKYRAMKMILTGASIPATEAEKLGLVAKLSPPGEALKGALELAGQLANNSTTALALAKEAICRSDELGTDETFERSLYYSAFGSMDMKEGVSAFLSKRAPKWPSHVDHASEVDVLYHPEPLEQLPNGREACV